PTSTSWPAMNSPVFSRQVDWWSVHTWVAAALAAAGSWPMAGTVEWCALDDTDLRKVAALFDAAEHWILRVETCQQAECDASHEVSAAADWAVIACDQLRHVRAVASGAYIPRTVQ
ncbi:MAG: DUF2742 domain-containing protein, partial [Mycobacterium sp.]|nr:DUF2742 domain-containing protein [Mycobacterium sp.]